MGIVQRQGLRNTVISYIGLALGFVSTALVLPNFLEPQQLGVTATLSSVATLYAQIAAFGFASVGIRFFPYFRHPESGHRGFLPLLLGVPLLGFAVVTALYFLGEPLLLRWYGQDAPLLAPYYAWGAVLALFTMLYSVLDAYLKALYHTAFSSFVQDILLRVLIVAGAFLFGFGYLSFPGYVLWFVGVNSALALLLAAYVAAIGELHWRPTRQVLTVRPLSAMLGMGAFTLLGSLSGSIIMYIDTLMVGAQVSVAAAGIYVVAGNISTALAIPARSLNKIAFPLLADYWKEQNLTGMADFYRRATRLNTLIGCLLFLGIALNLDFIYSLMRNARYAEGTVVVLLLLGSKLFDGITGVNGLLVVTSPRYRYDLVFNVSLALLTILLNALLIPRLGMVGAAVAACVAQVSINVARTWFVWHSYRMQPFTWQIPLILGFAAVAGVAGWLVPAVGSPLLTMLLRSTILTGVYATLVLVTNSAPEAVALLQSIRKRLNL